MSGDAELVFGDVHPNPHVKAFQVDPVDVQLQKIDSLGLEHACLYPSAKYLADVVDRSDYVGRPFTLRLALGEPQLELHSFDLRVLELYRRDPRYSYWTDDISGRLSVSDKYYGSNEMREPDQVLLEDFGFAYNERRERSVAVFSRYLSRLSPEHQQVWNAQLLEGDFRPHPDYWRQSMGDWGQGVSVFQAFVEELRQINRMCDLIGKPPLFKREFTEESRPKEFSFLIRPTLAEWNEFVLVLDKMLSENLNRSFFDGAAISEEAAEKGSLAMLEEWVRQSVQLRERDLLDQMFLVMKKVRWLRQRPAHALDSDAFSQRYFQDQRWLAGGAYCAVYTLRMILALHPAAREHQVPEFLNGVIWLY